MKKAINTRGLTVLAMVCLFLFSACHKLPECECGQVGTIIHLTYENDTCYNDEFTGIVLDESPNDTIFFATKIPKKFKVNGLRVAVELLPFYHLFEYTPPRNWCGPRISLQKEVKCINKI